MEDKTREELNEKMRLLQKRIAELEKFRILFESSRDAIMITEPPLWRFTSCNPAAVRLFGAKDEVEFISKGPAEASPEFQPDGASSSDKSKRMIQKAMDEGVNFFEWTHRRFDESEFFATVLLTRVEIEKGKPFLQATVRDITELKRIEKELKAAHTELENKVQERTRELRERVEELERFRKATIEREFRMKELRQEIERLKNKTGKNG
ncbi:MAG: PAS domain S-box protein [Candidatus Omnitrophota bacterium]